MILFRHADRRFPFLWETTEQPPARWHGPGEGPVQYFADTPDGAWAELIRHEDLRTADDLASVVRDVWAVEVAGVPRERPRVAPATMTGGPNTYHACRAEARRLRSAGARGFVAPSAALRPGAARGWRVNGGLAPAPDRDGRVIVLFDRRPDVVGWRTATQGRPDADLLSWVRYL